MDRQDIESIYPLTDSQAAMLAHHLQAGPVDRGRIQMQINMEGVVEPRVLEKAWAHLIRTFPVLRTTIHWRGLRQAVQVVHRNARCNLAVKDWTGLDPGDAEVNVQAYLQDDRDTGLDLTNKTNFRLALLQGSSRKSLLVWTCHHLLLDGWSSMLVLQEMTRIYGILKRDGDLQPARATPFKDYADWVASRPSGAARRFWKAKFRELEQGPTLLRQPDASDNAQTGRDSLIEDSFRLRTLEGGRLEQLARDCQVSPFTILLGTWVLILSELLDTSTVVTGVSVSGRNGHVPGEDSVAGMLANIIPVVIRINPDDSAREFLQSLGREIQAYQKFDYSSARQIHEWTGLPATRPLFDCLFGFANQPFSDLPENDSQALRITGIRGAFTTASPVNLSVWKWDTLSADILLDPATVDPGIADRIKSRLAELFSEPENLLERSVSALRRPTRDFLGKAGPATALQSGIVATGGPPKNSLEGQIQDVWKAVFELPEIGMEANFFDLGGNSLLATVMTVRVQEKLNRTVPIESLFEAPTIRALANLLKSDDGADQAGTRDTLLVSIREVPDSDKMPLVLVHGLGGSIYQYHLLAKYLDTDQPIFAIQSPREAFSDLERMSEAYLTELLNRFPDGKFVLGGYCFGAGIAYEILRLMRARGIQTYPLLAIDFMFMNLVRYRPRYLLSVLREESPKRFYMRVRNRVIKLWQRVKRFLKNPGRGIRTRVDDYMNLPEFQQADYERIDNYFFLLKNHRPKPYDGDLALVFSESDYSRLDKYGGWDRIVNGHMSVDILKTGHNRIMEDPEIQEVASVIERILHRINESD